MSFSRRFFALLTWLGLSLFSPFLFGNYGSVTVASIVNVYDGDTFRANIAHWPDVIGNNTPIRINAVDTPEIRGKCAAEKQLAIQARDFTREQLLKAELIELRNIERGKYFRLVADVYLDGQSLAQQLLSHGLARPYDGNKRQSWCTGTS
ncbi:thermonuclease family protein [Thalassotalea litorea]|uniref:Thermonuclease family protein n=1 Tax=Thalassotalea litorea TaxID=2020715 RepID=A0A5R9IJL4_9GAMM|nr:thermonuclease family protein [Thalassotalea litorea]TLU65715.1 thermonuclease family protein [Thalassotalea litorea]